jgi:hypothetical protein
MSSFAGSSVSWVCRPSFNLPAHRLEVPLHAESPPRNISAKRVRSQILVANDTPGMGCA